MTSLFDLRKEMESDRRSAERMRQVVELRAASPMRSTAPQRDAGELALFSTANEPTLF